IGTSSATRTASTAVVESSSRVATQSANGGLLPRFVNAILLSAIRRLRLARVAILHEPPAEPPLDAEVALGDRILERRRRLHDLVAVDVQRQRAAHAAVWTDRVGRRHSRLVPGPNDSAIEFRLCHQRAGGTDGDAVAAVDAGGFWQRHRELRRDVGVEPASGDGDRERVLMIRPARFDALVAENA